MYSPKKMLTWASTNYHPCELDILLIFTFLPFSKWHYKFQPCEGKVEYPGVPLCYAVCKQGFPTDFFGTHPLRPVTEKRKNFTSPYAKYYKTNNIIGEVLLSCFI